MQKNTSKIPGLFPMLLIGICVLAGPAQADWAAICEDEGLGYYDYLEKDTTTHVHFKTDWTSWSSASVWVDVGGNGYEYTANWAHDGAGGGDGAKHLSTGNLSSGNHAAWRAGSAVDAYVKLNGGDKASYVDDWMLFDAIIDNNLSGSIYTRPTNLVLMFRIDVGSSSGRELTRLWVSNAGTLQETDDITGLALFYENGSHTNRFEGNESQASLGAGGSGTDETWGSDSLNISIPSSGTASNLICYIVVTSWNASVTVGRTAQFQVIADGMSFDQFGGLDKKLCKMSALQNSSSLTLACDNTVPTVSAASSITTNSFTANWGAVGGAASYQLDVSTSSNFGGAAGASVSTNLVAFEFSAYAGAEGQGTATVVAVNMQSPVYITRGAGLTAAANAGRFNAQGWSTADANASAAFTGNRYFEWTIQPSAGYSITVTNVVLQLQRSNTGASNICLRSSADSYGSDLISTGPFAGKNVTFSYSSNMTSKASLQNVSGSLTFRMAAWPGASSGSTGFEGTGDDILIQGTIASASAPSFVPGYSNRSVSAVSQSVTGLTDNTAYYYRVRAVTPGSCTSGNSTTQSVSTLVCVPPQPTGLTASDGTSDAQVALSWNDVAGETGYVIFRNTVNTFGSAARIYTNAAGTVSYNDTGATPGQLYYYWVTATNTGGSSAESASNSGYRKLATVGSVAATDGTHLDRVTVTWGNVTGETGFGIWRHTADVSGSATFLASVAADTLTYDDTSATQGQIYYYWVRATNTTSTSQSDFSASDAGYRKLATVGSVAATDGTSVDYVTVTWGNVTGETGFGIWRHTADVSGSASFLASVAADTLTYDDTSATPGTKYYYWVRATNSTSTSQSDFSASNDGYRKLATVSGLTASFDTYATKIALSWSDITGETGYGIWRHTSDASASATFLASVTAGTLTYDDTTAVQGTPYYYWVRGTNNTSNSQGDFQANGALGRCAAAAPAPILRFTGFEGTTNDAWAWTASTTGSGKVQVRNDAKNQTGEYLLKLSGSSVGSGTQAAIFDNVSLTGITNVSVAVAFAAGGVDTGDGLYLELSYDNGATYTVSSQLVWGASNFDINFGSVDGARTVDVNPFTLRVPDGTSQVRVRVRYAEQASDNTYDYFFIDNLTLRGDTTKPTVSFGVTQEVVAVEGDAAFAIPITISSAADATVRVHCAGGAALGVDYTLSATSIVFAAGGATTSNLVFTVSDDTLTEGPEFARLTLTLPAGVRVAGPDIATVFIRDDEGFTLMSANLAGDTNKVRSVYPYSAQAKKLLRATRPDVAALQEWSIQSNETYRGFVDEVFGTNFYYVIEAGTTGDQDIPNGIVSRWPIALTNEWDDTDVGYRDFLHAKIDLPGSKDLNLVNVHLKAGSTENATRLLETRALSNYLAAASFNVADYMAIAGDLNLETRTDTCLTPLTNSWVTDATKPADNDGDTDTNVAKDAPYDVVLPNAILEAQHTAYSYNGTAFNSGMIFDTRLWDDHSYPALEYDTRITNVTHRPVIKLFAIGVAVDPPAAFSATPTSSSVIQLAFTRNAVPQDVVIVYDTDNTFSEPFGAAPAVGNPFAGGTVVYKGGTSPQNHSSLTACQTYYYRCWSYTNNNYSSSLGATGTTATLSAPTGLYANPTNANDFTANWAAVSGATGYQIDVSANNSFGGSGLLSFQGFEGGAGDTWGYGISNATTKIVTTMSMSGSSSLLITNGNAVFSNVVIAGGAATVSVAYACAGLDSGEDLFLDISYDQGGSWDSTQLIDGYSNLGINFGETSGYTAGANPYRATLTPGSTQVMVRVRALRANGSGENYYIDDVQLDGVAGSYVPGYENRSVGATSCAVTGLTDNTTYYFRVRATNDIACTSGDSMTQSVTTVAGAPTVQAKGVYFYDFAATSLSVAWTNGNGTDRLVVCRAGSAPSAGPVDGGSYTADADFSGGGTALGSGKVVYMGSGTNVTITGLSAQTQYYVQVFEFKGSGAAAKYNTNTADSNPANRYTLSADLAAHVTGFTATPVSQSQINLSWTAAAGSPYGYIVLLRTNSAPTGYPVDATTYAQGQALGNGVVAAIIPSGSATATNINWLTTSTTYYFTIMPYSYNGSSDQTYNYYTNATVPSANGTTHPGEPTTQAKGIYFNTIADTSFKVNWTNGTGAGRLVVCRQGDEAPSAGPTDFAPYTADTNFSGGGDSLGGGKVVYIGTASSFTLTGLTPATHYYLQVFEYNGTVASSSANFNTTTGVNNPNHRFTYSSEPADHVTSLAVSSVNDSQVNLSWVAASGPPSGYLVLYRSATSISDTPSDGQPYSASQVIGVSTVAVVVTPGNSVSTSISGLTAGKTNIFSVIPYNAATSNETYNYRTAATIPTVLATNWFAEPSSSASAVAFAAVQETQMEIQWSRGNGANCIVLVKAGGAVDANPADGTTYTADAAFTSGSQLGTGNYVVYSGSGTNVTLTGLTGGTTYYVAVYEFNGPNSLQNYRTTSPATGNQKVLINPTSITAVPDGKEMVRLAWTKNASFDVMIVYRASSASTAPSQGTAYNVGDACGGGTVLYKGSDAKREHVIAPETAAYYTFYSYNGSYYSSGVLTNFGMGAYQGGEIVEPFAYTNGVSLSGLNGAGNFAGAWSVGLGTWTVQTNYGASEVPYCASMPNYGSNAANRVKLSNPGNGGSGNATRSFSAITNGKIYAAVQMAYQYEGAQKWAGLSLMSNTTEKVFVGKLAHASNWRSFGLSGVGGEVVSSPEYEIQPFYQSGWYTGRTYLIVVAYDFSTRALKAKAFYRTDSIPTSEPGTWDASDTLNAGDLNLVDGIRIHAGSSDGGNTIGDVYFDEIRVGTSWSAVLGLGAGVPSVTTDDASDITPTTATGGGNVTSEGGASVSQRGVCWNTGGSPSTGDSCTTNGSGTGLFTSSLTGLTPGETYYIRAYAINANGTAYGSQKSFTANCFTNVPTLEAATGILGNSFTANWAAVEGALSYRLDVSDSANFSGEKGGGTNTCADIGGGTTSSYLNRNWTNNGVVWFAQLARIDQTINGAGAICFQNAVGGYMRSVTVTGGVGSVTFTHRLPYADSNGQLELFVNGVSKGTVTVSSSTQTSTISGVNVSGECIILLTNANTSARCAVSQFVWTPYGSSGSAFMPGYSNRTVSGTSAAVTGLVGETTYYYRLRAVGGGSCISGDSATGSVITLAAEPTQNPTSVTFDNVRVDSLRINWSGGDGAYRVVLVKQGGAVDANPADGSNYTASATFGSGDQLGTGNYVVYNGSASAVTVTNLSSGTQYYVAIYEYNGTGGKQNFRLTSPGTGNQWTLSAVTDASATTDGKEMARLAWTRFQSFDVMIVYRSGTDPTDPTQGTSYSVGSACGGGTVIYKGSSTNVEHILPPGTTAYYKFYSYSANNYYSDSALGSLTLGTYNIGEVVDQFAYTNGIALVTPNGGQGFSGPWTGDTNDFTVNRGSFANQANYPNPAANKVLVSPADNTAKYITRPFTAVTGGKIFASYIVNFQYGGGNKWAGASLMHGATEKIFFGECAGGDQYLGVHSTVSTKALTAGSGNDWIIVVRYDFATDDAHAKAYKVGTDIVPDDEPSSWDAEYLNVGGITQIDGISLRAGGNTAGATPGNCYYDEVRVSTNWSTMMGQTAPKVIYDNFTGSDGVTLSGQGGGKGWTGTWALGGNAPYVNTVSGSFGIEKSSYYQPAYNKICLYADVNGYQSTATRNFLTTFTTGLVYFSWMQNYEFNGNNKWAGLEILDSGGTAKAFIGKVSGADKLLGIDSSSANVNSTENLENGTGNDYVIVAKYDFSTRELSAVSFKTTAACIAEEPRGYWQVTSTQTAGHITSIKGVKLTVGATDAGAGQIGDVFMDEVRIGTNWFETVRKDGEAQASVLAAGPVPKLLYVGTNYIPSTNPQGSLTNITVTDRDLKNLSEPLDFAVLWTSPSGMWVTNSTWDNKTFSSRAGNITPNWDPVVKVGEGTPMEIGYDAYFTNYIGANGALSMTTYMHSAFNITNSAVGDRYFITMSAQNRNYDGGSFASPSSGADDVGYWRALTVNSNLEFFIFDDDESKPEFANFTVNGYGGQGDTNLVTGGIAIIGVNGSLNPVDKFSFVVLSPFPSNTVIEFIDCGWSTNANNWFRPSEFHWNKYVSEGGGDVGKVFELTLTNFNNGGDQIAIYQYQGGSTPTQDPNNVHFINAINLRAAGNGWFTEPLTDANEYSCLYRGLTNGQTAVSCTFSGNADMIYTGTTVGTASYLLKQISDSNNWAQLPTGTNILTNFSFSVTGAGEMTWTLAEMTDEELLQGGFVVTSIWRDVGRGLIATNNDAGCAPYLLIYNTNSAIAASNYFDVSFANGNTDWQTLTMTSSVGYYENITIGVISTVVFVADADNDRNNDSIGNSLSLNVTVTDDDAVAPKFGTTPMVAMLGDVPLTPKAFTNVIAGFNFNATNPLVSFGVGILQSNTTTIGYSAGTTINAIEGDAAGQDATFTGSGNIGKYIQFTLDMRACSNLVMSVAARRSGTGYDNNSISYSVNGGAFTDHETGWAPNLDSFALKTVNFTTVPAINNASQVIVRITFNVSVASGAGNNRFDNFQFAANADRYYEVTDSQLAALGAGNPLSFSFNVYDEYSGLARGAGNTNMYVTIGGMATENRSNFDAARSATITTNTASTSVWSFATAYTYEEIGSIFTNMRAAQPIRVYAADRDFDRVGDQMAEEQTLGFWRVVDDDTNAPVVVTNMQRFADHTTIDAAFAVATNNGVLRSSDLIRGNYRRREGSGTNVVYSLTDADMALINAGTWDMQMVFALTDDLSGFRRPTNTRRGPGDNTNNAMSISIGDVIRGDLDNFNASDSSANVAGSAVTNVWRFGTGDFPETVVTQMMDMTEAGSNLAVCITSPDADNDRTNDLATLTSFQVGSLRVFDDDVNGPLMGAMHHTAAFGGESVFADSFETSQGWPSGGYSSSEGFTNSTATAGTYIGLGVLHATFDPKYSGVRRIGFLTNSFPNPYLQLPPVDNPGNFFAYVRLVGSGSGNATMRLERANAGSWVTVGDRPVTNSAVYEMLNWEVDYLGNAVTLRVIRVDSGVSRSQVYMDDISMTRRLSWVRETNLTVQWSAAVDDYNGVSEYRYIAPSPTNDLVPRATNVGVWLANSATQVAMQIQRQGVSTGFVFAIDNDNDRNNDRSVGAPVPLMTRVDWTAPTQVVNIVGEPGYWDDTSEIDLNWSPVDNGGGEGANPLSPWHTYRVYYTDDGVTTPTTNSAFWTVTNYANLGMVTNDKVTITNLEFGSVYELALQGIDEAGNNGPLSTSVVVTLLGFAVTQGVGQAAAVDVSWTAMTNRLSGTITKCYDLIYVDTWKFRDTLSNSWTKVISVTNSCYTDGGGTNPDGGSRPAPNTLSSVMRFYRASQHNRWRTNQTRRIGSEQVYVMRAINLRPGKNWVSLPGIPDTSTPRHVFGFNLPQGTLSALATTVSWYEKSTNGYFTNMIWLSSANGGQWMQGEPGFIVNDTLMGFGEAFIVQLPTNGTAVTWLSIGRIPTNGVEHAIKGGTRVNPVYNFVGFNLPTYMHPYEMNLLASGFKSGSAISRSDRLLVYDRATQTLKNGMEIWCDSAINPGISTCWKFSNGANVPWDYVGPDDSLVIISANPGDWVWTNKPPYVPPNRFMNP